MTLVGPSGESESALSPLFRTGVWNKKIGVVENSTTNGRSAGGQAGGRAGRCTVQVSLSPVHSLAYSATACSHWPAAQLRCVIFLYVLLFGVECCTIFESYILLLVDCCK